MLEAGRSTENNSNITLKKINPYLFLWSDGFCPYPENKIGIPAKILRREILCKNELCTMGSIVVPPSTPITQENLIDFWHKLNSINTEQARPADSCLFIRTATNKGILSFVASGKKSGQETWSNPAALTILNKDGSISGVKYFGKDATPDINLEDFFHNNRDHWLIDS